MVPETTYKRIVSIFLMKMKNDNYMRERLLSLRTGKGKNLCHYKRDI